MPPASTRRSTAIAAELVVAACGAAGVLAVRLASWTKCWRWAITEGREGPVIYALWRLLHGRPLYEPTVQEPYTVTFYNFGFYEAYAFVMRHLGVNDERLLSEPRLLSLAGAAFGAVLFVLLGARLARPVKRLEWLTLGSLAFVVWFGSQFVSWWAFAVRPDVWAAAFALGGLSLVVGALEETRVERLVLASLVFAGAWSFKQSSVWTFAGALVGVTLEERRASRSLALLAPFAVVAAVSLYAGGAVYRENIIQAPALSRFHWSLFAGVFARAIPQNPFVFGFWPLVFAWESRSGLGTAWRKLARAERLLVVVALVTVLFGSVALGREGSNKNHLLEGFVACALAAWCALQRLPAAAPRWLSLAGGLAALPLAVLPVLQLGAAAHALPANRFGRTLFCDDADARAFTALNQAIVALPHPLFADDDVFSQPWHSTADRYPALVLDGGWYAIARREGLLPGDFPLGALRERGYHAAVLPVPNPVVDVLQAHGARCSELSPRPLGLTYVVCRLDE
ncbi:MAG TPA: hypothetical protein VMI54_21165 [Polyangiaceae bacterium]|nr:hypothetical protein [Polyangiaceae bacterium]